MYKYDPTTLQAEADRFKPKLIKRYFDGKYRTFKVLENMYEEDTDYIALVDEKTNEWYNGVVINGNIQITSKAEEVYVKSYDEFRYLMYGEK